MSIPVDIGRFTIFPGRKIYGLLITAKNEDILATLVSILAKYNILTLYLSYSRLTNPPRSKGMITALAFLDLSESEISLMDLVRRLEQAGSVRKIKIIRPKIDGFIADYISFPLKIRGNRAIIIRDIGYKGLIAGIRDKFGTGAEAFLYYLGFEAGKEYGRDHKKIAGEIGLKDPAKIHDIISAAIFNSVGYGLMETIKFNSERPYALIRVYHSFECELGLKSNKPYSHLIRGMIAGVISELLGKEMLVQEIKCIAKGDSYCEFEVIPKT